MSYDDDHAPRGVIVDGIVTNADQLKRYWAVVNERKERSRRSMLYDLREAATTQNENPTHEEEPWSNKQWDAVNQLRSMVLYLQEKVNKTTDKKAVDKQDYEPF